MKFKSEVQLEALNNATTDTDKFLVSDGGIVKYRTGEQTLSDLSACKAVNLTVATASATAAKVTTESVTFEEGALYLIKFTLGNSVSAPTLNGISIRLGTSSASTTTFSIGNGTIVPMYYNATNDVMQITGSYRTSDSTEDYNLRWENSVQAGEEITRYKIIMEGIDGRFWPLTIGNTTAATKTVSTQEFRLDGTILMYNSTATVAANAVFTNVYVSEYFTTTNYTFNQSSGFIAYRSVYLVGTVNSNGNFVLDNTTLTSWLTQTLPTTDDGKVYIYLGITNNTFTAFRLEVTHPIYQYKNGKLGLYSSIENPITGTGTTDYISKFTGSTTLGDSQIFDNGTNVGIGTNIPSALLNVYGNLHLGAYSNLSTVNIENRTGKSVFYISTDGVNNAVGTTITYSWAGGGQGPLKFNNASGEVMRLDYSGKLGVGTTNPTSRIHSVTSAAGPVSYENRCAIFGDNTATSTVYPNSVGVAGRVLTSDGRAIYGDATTGGGWGGYFDGKGYFSGNVGIGTTSPSTRLQVVGGSDAWTGLALRDGGSDIPIIDFRVSDNSTRGSIRMNGVNSVGGDRLGLFSWVAGTGLSEVMSIKGGGNVGIGTTSPNNRLSVAGNIETTTGGKIGFNVNDAYGNFPHYGLGWPGGVNLTNLSGYFGLSFGTVGTERMRITTAGNVGIETTSPVDKLDVNGAMRFRLNTPSFTGAIDSGVLDFVPTSIFPTDPQVRLAAIGTATVGSSICFLTGLSTTMAERMRITSSGFVGIGTTAPTYRLQVSDTIASVTAFGNFAALQSIGGTGYRWSLNNDSTFRLQYTTNGFSTVTTPLFVTSNGALGVGVTPTNTAGRLEAANDIVAYSSSDKRWKTNIKNIDSPLEKISQINGVEFDWIEDEPVHGNKGHDIGVIAQEIEKILPDAVQTRESGMKAVKYEKVIPLLIEAIKEQQKQIEELKQLLNGITN